MKTLVKCIGLFCAFAGAAAASPVEFGFTRVEPHNAPVNPGSQFKMLVDTVSASQVSIKFTNAVGIASSISEIYFDDAMDSLLGSIASLTQVGTNFTSGGANPGNLPGGNNLTPPFQADSMFSADAQGNPSNGIDTAGDSLTMIFNLKSSINFTDLLNALNSGGLRVGLHVRAIGQTGDSDSFVNNPIVPLPAAAWPALATIGGLGFFAHRRRQR